MKLVPSVLVRGGSSRGLLILEESLAGIAETERRAAFAYAVGSPDPDARQVNGVGGGNATTSKVAVVAPSQASGHDVDYSFYQIIVATGECEVRGTCGNLVAAVGQFAIEAGLVPPVAPTTRVTIRDVNTGASIGVDVPVTDDQVVYIGDKTVAGVPGTGAPIPVRFLHPAGRVTGRLLPGGTLEETVTVDGRDLTVSFVDSVNPVVLVHASSLPPDTPWSLTGIEGAPALLTLFENLRALAAVKFGLADDADRAQIQSPFLPFVGLYTDPLMGDVTGTFRPDPTATASVRLMSGGQPHRAVPLSAGLATATLARLRTLRADPSAAGLATVRLEHASGIIEIEIDADPPTPGEQPEVRSVGVVQTARPIMTGSVYFP